MKICLDEKAAIKMNNREVKLKIAISQAWAEEQYQIDMVWLRVFKDQNKSTHEL